VRSQFNAGAAAVAAGMVLLAAAQSATGAGASVRILSVTRTVAPGGIGVVRLAVSHRSSYCRGKVTGPQTSFPLRGRGTRTGRVQWRFRLAADAAPGRWRVSVTCARAGSAAAGFNVPAPPERPSPPSPPSPPQPPQPELGTRANPFPFAAPAHDSRWEIRVNSVTWDAWPVISVGSPALPPPPFGLQDVMVNITTRWLGTDLKSMGDGELDTSLNGVAANDNTYYNRTGGGVLYACGEIPTPLDRFFRVLPNTPFSGNICWQALATDVPTLQLRYWNSVSNAQGWFALR
jgi:hypothetical protein